jgi:tetraacyldisaccharide 4'-kinase
MTDLVRYLQKLWYDEDRSARPFLDFSLHVLSLPYAAGTRLRNLLYDHGLLSINRVSCPVVSVGNLTVGGTGKTPAVILIAGLLREAGYKPAVLSRGYSGRNGKAENVVSDGINILTSAEDTGDESILMARSLEGTPVLTGPERYRTARYAIENLGCNVLVLDDGFQHRALFRNLDIVLMDSEKPFGNGILLPRGPLREPLESLRRADLLILTRSDEDTILTSQSSIKKAFPDMPIFTARHRPKAVHRSEGAEIHPPGFLAGKKVLAFAGIAKPMSFEKTVRALGALPLGFVSFPDHHIYKEGDIRDLKSRAAGLSADLILTTEKDAVRLIPFGRFFEEVYVLSIEMEITAHEGVFAEWLLNQLKS